MWSPRWGVRAPAAGALVLAALVGACASPDREAEEARRGSLEEFRELLAQEGLEPIEWEELEGPVEDPNDVLDGTPLPDLLQPNPDYTGDSTLPPLLDPGALAAQSLGSEEGEETAAPGAGVSGFSGNPYLLFGPRIVLQPGGLITKVYPLPPGKGIKMLELMEVLTPFPVVGFTSPGQVPAGMERDPEVVEVVLLEHWDQEPYQDLTVHPPPIPTQVDIADWMVVTATEELLWEVESFVKVFAAGVPQIEIEAKIVEVTESDEIDVGVRAVRSSVTDELGNVTETTTPTLTTLGSTDFDADGNPLARPFVDDFTFDFPNRVNVAESFLSLSTIQPSYAISAIIEAVKNWENVSINSQPKIAVREGGTASIVNTTDIPFYGFSGINAAGNFQANLQLKEVGTKLYVVPRVVADTVAMDINLEISQQVGTLVSFTGSEGDLVTPIIAKRQAKTVVYLEPGQAVVLGGLTSERTVHEESMVPILGEIPLLGLLFRSTFQRKETTHVIFIIRPRILQAAELRNEF